MIFDAIDAQLVRALQRDGRAPYEALAQEIGLARSTIRSRVQRLLDSGSLRVIGAIHPSVYGLNAFAEVAIEIDGPVQPVADQVTAFPETSFVTTTTGRFAIGTELRTTDTDALAAGIGRIQAINGVHAVRTVVYQRIWKDPYFPPNKPANVEVDDADHTLLDHLRTDGRASFAELANVTGLSPGATRSRVLRLLSSGVLHVGALVRLDAVSHAHTFGFALSLEGETEPIARRVADLDQVDFLATGIGWCNGIGVIRVRIYDEVYEALEQIRAIPGVRTLESWAHLRATKEEHDAVTRMREACGARTVSRRRCPTPHRAYR